MLHAIQWHLSEELLDEYVRRTLPSEDAIAFVEEHILVCKRCRQVVSETDDLVDALRYAFSAAEEPLLADKNELPDARPRDKLDYRMTPSNFRAE